MFRTNFAASQARQLHSARFESTPPLAHTAPLRQTSAMPFTLSTVATRAISTLPHKFSSSKFDRWPVWPQPTRYDFSLIKQIFTTPHTESPLGMSREKFLAIQNKTELLSQLSAIVDSFFPVDHPLSDSSSLRVDDEIRTAFANAPTAQNSQRQILEKIMMHMGIQKQNSHFVLAADFSLEQCSLLHTANGRKALSQIVRSLHLLGNEQLAKNLQELLVSISIRYAIPAPKIIDILLATDPSYWSKRSQAAQHDALAKTLITAFKFEAPRHLPVQKMVFTQPEHTHYLCRTGDRIADYFLGFLPDQNQRFLVETLHTPNSERLFSREDSIAGTLFPIDASEDTQRCFMGNPLLRSIQRKSVDFALTHLGLVREGKGIRLQDNITVDKLAWLESNNAHQRALLLRMVKSLNLLDNQLLASNMQKCIGEILSWHYQGNDKDTLLAQLKAINPATDITTSAKPKIETPTQITPPKKLTLLPASPIPTVNAAVEPALPELNFASASATAEDNSALHSLLLAQGIDSSTANRVITLVQQKMPAGALDHTLKYDMDLSDHQARLILDCVCHPEEIDAMLDTRENALIAEDIRAIEANKRAAEIAADKQFTDEYKLALEFSLRDIKKEQYDILVIGSQINDNTGKKFDKQRAIFADAGGYADLNGDIHQTIDTLPLHKKLKEVHFTGLPGSVFDNAAANLRLFQKLSNLMEPNGKLVVKFGIGMIHSYDNAKFAQEILRPTGFDRFTFSGQSHNYVELSARKSAS